MYISANNVFIQILEDTNILFPDDELDILDLDEDELLFEVCFVPLKISLFMILTGLRIW